MAKLKKKIEVELNTTPARHSVTIKTNEKEKRYCGYGESDQVEKRVTIAKNEGSDEISVFTQGNPSVPTETLVDAFTSLLEARA